MQLIATDVAHSAVCLCMLVICTVKRRPAIQILNVMFALYGKRYSELATSSTLDRERCSVNTIFSCHEAPVQLAFPADLSIDRRQLLP